MGFMSVLTWSLTGNTFFYSGPFSTLFEVHEHFRSDGLGSKSAPYCAGTAIAKTLGKDPSGTNELPQWEGWHRV